MRKDRLNYINADVSPSFWMNFEDLLNVSHDMLFLDINKFDGDKSPQKIAVPFNDEHKPPYNLQSDSLNTIFEINDLYKTSSLIHS